MTRPLDVFARLWGVAVLAHVIGNPAFGQVIPTPTLRGVVALVSGLVGLALLLAPRTWLLATSAGLVLASVWLEAPVLGNHWLLAGFVAVAVLLALSRPDPWAWFKPTGQLLLLVAYGFAAFAKLNTAFFDPEVSCAPVLANRSLAAAGLPTIPLGGTTALLVAIATAAVEMAIPIMLAVSTTRWLGVVTGTGFHFLISLDFDQHFYDFTAVLMALFLLFLSDRSLQAIGESASLTRRVRRGVIVLVGTLVVLSVGPLTPLSAVLVTQAVFAVWIPFGVWWIHALWRHGERSDGGIKVQGAVAAVVVLLAAFNGLTPYLELKTGYGWNMYANLMTANGESNHLLVRRTLPLTDEQRDPVVVLATTDPGLQRYVGSGYAIPTSRFAHYLAARPEVEVTYRGGGHTTPHTAKGETVGRELPVLQEKFGLFRAVDLERPVRCQLYWLPSS